MRAPRDKLPMLSILPGNLSVNERLLDIRLVLP